MEDFILQGDIYAGLSELSDESISVTITSPPYWKQRDYGFEGQIGKEETPEDYVGKLVKIFDLLRKKMVDDGVFFLNIGYKYFDQYGKSHLLGLPYKIAWHMCRRGWILKDILIWKKTNYVPSPVSDRFVNAYEPILVFVKQDNNIYKENRRSVIELPLQQTEWKHTAVFPETLITDLIYRCRLRNGDLVLDPFAGTGTVAMVVKKFRSHIFGKKIFSISIEMGSDFISIIKRRTGIGKVRKVENVKYNISSIEDEFCSISPTIQCNDPQGEVVIETNCDNFLSNLAGIDTDKFRNYHTDEALYFFGVKDCCLDAFYYASNMDKAGHVLRNIIIIKEKKSWYPVFMFAKHITTTTYRFNLDAVRTNHKEREVIVWHELDVRNYAVTDITNKETEKGIVSRIIRKYPNGFPNIVQVDWKDGSSLEMVIHPERDIEMQESLVFSCPRCKEEISIPLESFRKGACPHCSEIMWNDLDSLPIPSEDEGIYDLYQSIVDLYRVPDVKPEGKNESFNDDQSDKNTNSKFRDMERVNWGKSPGARQSNEEITFTKMRLYDIPQPVVYAYLNAIRKEKKFTIQQVIDQFPDEYEHTVGHWFRKDLSGSIPVQEDLQRLRSVLESDHEIFRALRRTALKLQMVKASSKGKNPSDFLDAKEIGDVGGFCGKLYRLNL